MRFSFDLHSELNLDTKLTGSLGTRLPVWHQIIQVVTMPQSLVNERSGEVVEVPEGENLIGRAPLLKVADKRVSRNHALLDLENGKLKLCPKHRNPCFYKASGKDNFTVLPRDVWQELHHGDLISLLPDDLIFRVVEEYPTDRTVQSEEEKSNKGTIPAVTTSRDIMDDLFEPMETEPSNGPSPEAKKKLASEDTKNSGPSAVTLRTAGSILPTLESASGLNSASQTLKIDASESSKFAEDKDAGVSKLTSRTPSTRKARILPGWLSEINSGTNPPSKKRKVTSKAALKREDEEEPHPLPHKKAIKKGTTGDRTSRETKEREHHAVKPPPEKHTDDKKDTKPVAVEVANSALDKPASSALPATSESIPATKESKREGKKLPLCPFGTKCYRKNPIHFQEYSHDFSSSTPDSADSGDGSDDDKPMCPYGTACYRKNPAHRKEYRHTAPPSTRPAAVTRHSDRKTKGKKQSVLSGDSDDDGGPNTYDYNDSFIDDKEEDSSSSYGNGDSEDSDWAPPNEDGEDVRELVADAESFVSNKKMRKPV